MGIQTIDSLNNDKLSLAQASPLSIQNPWYNLTLNEVERYLTNLGKPLGGMNLNELLQKVWAAEATQSNPRKDSESTSSSSSLQRQASFTLAMALSGKTIDQLWKEILLGKKTRYSRGNTDMKVEEIEQTFGEVTLEDFLVQAGLFAETSIGSSVELDSSVDPATPEILSNQLSLSPTPSLVGFSGRVSSGRKRDHENIERKLKRKIKNRESAARSRARRQAYHNELVNKVSRLEEENIKLKKEKEFEKLLLPCEEPSEPKYQLRRTSSVSF